MHACICVCVYAPIGAYAFMYMCILMFIILICVCILWSFHPHNHYLSPNSHRLMFLFVDCVTVNKVNVTLRYVSLSYLILFYLILSYTYLKMLFGWNSQDMTSWDSTLGVIATLTIGASARCAFLNAYRTKHVRASRMSPSAPTQPAVLRERIDGSTLQLKSTQISTITITTMVLKVC